jgi:hypothetical protein
VIWRSPRLAPQTERNSPKGSAPQPAAIPRLVIFAIEGHLDEANEAGYFALAGLRRGIRTDFRSVPNGRAVFWRRRTCCKRRWFVDWPHNPERIYENGSSTRVEVAASGAQRRKSRDRLGVCRHPTEKHGVRSHSGSSGHIPDVVDELLNRYDSDIATLGTSPDDYPKS